MATRKALVLVNGQVQQLQAADTLSGAGSGNTLLAVATKTADYSVAGTDGLILADATSAAFTLTLPTATGIAGTIFFVKKTDSTSNIVSVASTSSQTFDGQAGPVQIVYQNTLLAFVSDGSNWQIM